MTIDPKYQTQSLKILTDEEKIREAIKPKTKISLDIFTEDLELANKLHINLSRIIRFKFHDWLQEKVQPDLSK